MMNEPGVIFESNEDTSKPMYYKIDNDTILVSLYNDFTHLHGKQGFCWSPC